MPWATLLLATLGGLLVAAAPAQSGRLVARRSVALTFDDLPATSVVGGDCDAARLLGLNRRLLAQLARFEAPATGLVTASRVCDALRDEVLPAALSLWLDAGHELGNHSFSHPDLNRIPLEEYERDIVRGETPVRRLLAERGRELRYFRHPLLHAGADVATKDALAAFLEERGYTVAPVTLDSQEWIFAAVYARAKARGDQATMRRVADAYVPFMEEVFAFFEQWSVEVLGREIPQVLLLHVNELNSDHLDRLLVMMRRRGYDFVSLDDALRDDAYRSEDGYVGPRGLSWLHRWALARGMEPREEPREPEWLAELFRAPGTAPAAAPVYPGNEGAPTALLELDPSLQVQPLEEGLWLYRATRVLEPWGPVSSNGLVIAGAGGAWVVDTPWTDRQTRVLLDWVEAEVGPVRGVIATHFHEDRLGGVAEAHRRGIETWGHEETARLAPAAGLEPPRRTFAEGVDLSTGSETLELYYPGAGHAPDNTVVWLADRRLLFGGCLIKSAGSRTAGFLGDAVLTDWPASLAALEKRYPEARTVIPGHGAGGSLELIPHTRSLVAAARAAASELRLLD